jgi:hypothetical protein
MDPNRQADKPPNALRRMAELDHRHGRIITHSDDCVQRLSSQTQFRWLMNSAILCYAERLTMGLPFTIALMIIASCVACSSSPVATKKLARSGNAAQPPAAAICRSDADCVQRTYPPLGASCASDADCVLVGFEIEDDLPRTHACCPACTERAASRDWLARFRAACEAKPPPMCPPLGCPMPILRALCQQGKCAAVH